MMVQMVPVAQIGSMLSNNQWTEELPHNCEETKSEVGFIASFIPPDQHKLVSMFCDSTTLIFLHISDQIPTNHSTDIVSPPPDVTSII